MSNQELGAVTMALVLLVVGAHLLGQLFASLRQPRVVGEIVAGIVLGPSLLGNVAPTFSASVFGSGKGDPKTVALGFVYHLGLLLLMFVSGAAVKGILARENRRPTVWLFGVGTSLPFCVGLAVTALLPMAAFTGSAGSPLAVRMIFACAVAVTSIPVITKIFYDLGILHTRFASLMLGAAVLEDLMLWSTLSVAAAIAAASGVAGPGLLVAVSRHVAATVIYVGLAVTVMPALLRRLGAARWNFIARRTPAAWVMAVFLGYVSVAAAADVSLVFAAFLAGFGIVGGMKGAERASYGKPLDAIEQIACAFFVPAYFAIIGHRLDFSETFDPLMFFGFLVGSSVIHMLSVALAARLAGFRGLAVVNLSITSNARGGPGIVLAGVAFDAGIINATFFTALVLTALLTCQLCGFWLDLVLRKGWPLLGQADGEPVSRRWPSGPADVPVEPVAAITTSAGVS